MTADERRMFNTIAGFLDRDAQGNERWTTPDDGARKLMLLLRQSADAAAAPGTLASEPLDDALEPEWRDAGPYTGMKP